MQAWPAPNVKPKLTQEAFDEAVKTNIEDFDMTPEEAVKSATDEFQLQGYDMSCVVKTSAGSDLSKHAINLATQAITDAGSDTSALLKALNALQALLDAAVASGNDALQETSAVAIKASTLGTVLSALKSHTSDTSDKGTTDTALIQAALTCARSLMAPSIDIRDSFEASQGPQLLMTLHQDYKDNTTLQTEIAKCAECACFRQEQNKDLLMQSGYGVSLLQLLAAHAAAAQPADAAADGVEEAFVTAACGVLRALTTADDDRPPCSKAFPNARLLAKQHQALSVLLSVLRLLRAPSCAPTVAGVFTTVRQLSANEEICKDFSDDGGVTACLTMISSMSSVSKDVVRCGLSALRQLTHSDHNKRLLAELHAPELLMKLTALYPDDVEVAEPSLGVMANMTLRQPDTVVQCAEVGVIDWVVNQMRDYPDNSSVQRQASILVRNMVSRTPEYRPEFLTRGVETLLRQAKRAHPKNCTDVGSAALRDLGCDNYNENWKVGGDLDKFLKAGN